MTTSLVVGLVLGLQPPLALRDASLTRRAVLGAASAAGSPLLVGGIVLPASAKEPEPSAADLYREVAADTAGLRKDIVTLRTSSSSLLGELKKNLESTQGAASRLVALGGDLNASATLLGGALAEGDAVAGRLSAVESTLLATASAGFQEADSLSGSTSTAALAARSYAKAEGLATQYSEAKDELKAFRAVVATAKSRRRRRRATAATRIASWRCRRRCAYAAHRQSAARTAARSPRRRTSRTRGSSSRRDRPTTASGRGTSRCRRRKDGRCGCSVGPAREAQGAAKRYDLIMLNRQGRWNT